MPRDDPLLEVRHIVKSFSMQGGFLRISTSSGPRARAVDDVSIAVSEGECLGIVGESGSGKTTLARIIVRLVEPDSGRVLFRNSDIFGVSSEERRQLARKIQLIYQDPYSSLNPVLSVGSAIVEPAIVYGFATRRQAKLEMRSRLDQVHLPSHVAKKRPSELSGGERQRVAIARALSARPEVLIADEAVSALDVSIQAQILDLLREIKDELRLTLIFISHQLPIVRSIADRVAVMYLGRVVELGPTDLVFERSAHPYTLGLLEAQPGRHRRGTDREPAIKGEMPSPVNLPSGCRFRTRCSFSEMLCSEVDPPEMVVAEEHLSWCHVLPRRRARQL